MRVLLASVLIWNCVLGAFAICDDNVKKRDVPVPTPPLIDAVVRSAAFELETDLRPRVRIGGHSTKDMSNAERLLAVYERALELDAHLDMGNLASSIAPQRKKALSEIFDQRRLSREEDLKEFETSEGDFNSKLQLVVEREKDRTEKFCHDLSGVLTQKETDQLVQQIVRRRMVFALTFPTVAGHFHLSADQVSELNKSHRKMMQALASTKELSQNGSPKADQRGRALAEAFNVLSEEQLEKFFRTTGQLKDSEDLIAVADRYPVDMRSFLLEVFLNKETTGGESRD
tara:strand:- start:651 stop:1511 length:861 start_codon:yes stop_codon:yes gene_type:complete